MQRKMTVHDHTRICNILFWLGVIIVVISSIFSEPLNPHWLLWVGLAVFLSAFIYRLLTVRCPHCHDGWFGQPAIPEYCPKCGKKID